jgi:D-alanyl-D-alanine carboxypeptidase.
MKNETSDDASTDKPAKFYSALETALKKRNLKREDICDETDAVQVRILNDYGAVFLATDSVRVPPVCMFKTREEVENFQAGTNIATEVIDGAEIQLQAAAMEAYLNARREAQSKGLNITPRDGSEAGRRSFEDTVRLWNSRFEPACAYWLKKGRLTAAQVEKLKSLPVNEQVKEVLELEKRGIFFNTFFNKSILYSVAAPGTSQHLSMLALDINEYENKKVREIMHKHGWFRTVRNDAPHFTYLGYEESELQKLGLKRIDGDFWIPNV